MDEDLDHLMLPQALSIRAVIAREGEDVSAALAMAGIFDPVAITVHIGEEGMPADGLLGDGVTPNPVAVLEIDAAEDADPA